MSNNENLPLQAHTIDGSVSSQRLTKETDDHSSGVYLAIILLFLCIGIAIAIFIYRRNTRRRRPHRSFSRSSKREPYIKTPDKYWLELQFNNKDQSSIKTPLQLVREMQPTPTNVEKFTLNRVAGSIIGMAVGDALGAHVEFRPHDYLKDHPVTDLQGGGTWGLEKGQFTDDTSMALCLAVSLIVRQDFVPFDQMVRYKWWYQHGYMSSTGNCFDIGAAIANSLSEFHRRQMQFARDHSITEDRIDQLPDPQLLLDFPIYCSEDGVVGNGALTRLAPVPLFFHRHPAVAVEHSGVSGQITHGDIAVYDACRYYGALIVAVLRDYRKDQLLDDEFYDRHKDWFGNKTLHPKIDAIARGSYKKIGGYDDGIRGKGYIGDALEAALWSFWSTTTFEEGVLSAVNLGDDTDTTAAIYGQLAGAYYGYDQLPRKWRDEVYAKEFLMNISQWIVYEGSLWNSTRSHAQNNQQDLDL